MRGPSEEPVVSDGTRTRRELFRQTVLFARGALVRFGYRIAFILVPLLYGSFSAARQIASKQAATVQATQSLRTIALTFDDLPMTVVGNDHIAGPLNETQYINASILRALQTHHATALGLVNEAKLNVTGERDARTKLLEDWLEAGMLLGNHGYSHRDFSELSIEQYEEEFLRGDVITVPMLQAHGLVERFFRPPYFDSGDTMAKKESFGRFLALHGYRVTPFTIQNLDWLFNASYDAARRLHNEEALGRIRSAYLIQTANEFDHAEQLTRESFNRNIPQIMFMHADALNADTLDAVLSLMEQRGYRFISIDEAVRDPAYNTAEAFVGKAALSWLDLWQPALGRPIRPAEPRPPAWVRQNYNRITVPKAP